MEAEVEANGMLESKEVDMTNGEGAGGDGDEGAQDAEDEDGADQVGIEELNQAVVDVRQHAEYDFLALHSISEILLTSLSGRHTRMPC